MMNLISDIGNVLDTPGSILRASLAGRNPFTGIFDPEHRVSGRDMLESWGLLGKNRPGLDAGDALGTAAEMFFDPTNAFGLGIANKLLKSAAKIKAANAVSKRLRAMGAMPEEIAKLTKIVDETGNPLRTYHGTRHAFDAYDVSRANSGSLFGPGVYTTDSAKIANTYPMSRGPVPATFARRKGITDEQIVSAVAQNHPEAAYLSSRNSPSASALADDARKIDDLVASAEMRKRLPALRRFYYRQVTDDPLNVRMQYIDARKPFDVDAQLGRAAESLVPEVQKRISHQEIGSLPFFQKLGPSMTGGDLYDSLDILGTPKARINDILRAHGYDAITHTGGQVTGGRPHKVVIAFDPSQIYAPYIAPALQRERRLIPALSPVAAALFGHNALARSHGDYGPREPSYAY